MDLDRLKDDFGQTWKWLAEGWRNISNRAAHALTYFAPGGQVPENDGEMRWGLLAADVAEHDDRIVVALEAPGLDKEDIDIRVEARRLVVSGSKRYESERKEGSMRVTERAFGRFQRVIPLPDEVTPDGASARYDRGVLTVNVPKMAPPERRKITVVSG